VRSPLVPPRSYEPEILDRPNHPPAEIARAMRDLSRINRWLGGTSTLWEPLAALIEEHNLRAFTLLDAGTGGGDVPRAVVARAAALGLEARAVGIDLDPVTVSYAASQTHHGPTGPRGERQDLSSRIAFVGADALRLPFPDRSFDFVTSSMMFHHFREEAAARLLAELARVARRAVIVNDLERNLVSWAVISVLVPFAESPMVRHDGPLSVLRGWTAAELASVARAAGLGPRSSVLRLFPYRLVLTVRTDPGGAA